MSDLTVALRYLGSGLSLLPIRTDGTKAPALSWKAYQTRHPTPEEVVTWCRQHLGVGIIGGQVSGNLEVLDFDAPELFTPWCDMVEDLAPGLVQRLPLVKTPSDGRHLYYRCDAIAGNQKLAQQLRHGKVKTLIETRGEGGYVLSPLCPPSCHELGKYYKLLDGDLTDIPTIAPDDRHLLWQAARTFNSYAVLERTVVAEAKGQRTSNGDRPGDLYNARVSWADILRPYGWTIVGRRGEVTLWKRPGKRERGWSATTGCGQDRLYVFSTNAAPFEAGMAYDKFGAYALLEHRGNMTAAGKALYAQGYRAERSKTPGSDCGVA
jgi:hypothetical protein